jgi:hypothetical protein
MSSGGASKRQEEPDEPRDPILTGEQSWLRQFESMSVDEAIRDIKAIKPSRFHLGDIFRTQNGKFYVVTAGKKDSSDVYFYRIQGLDGTIRVRREDQITDLYGSPTVIPMNQVSQLLSTIAFPNNLDIEILTERHIRRNDEDGRLRTRREMVQLSLRAAQSSRLAEIRGRMRDELASHIPAGRQDLLIVFENLSVSQEVRQIVASEDSEYHLGDFFFRDNVFFVVTAGRLIPNTSNAPTNMFYRINGTDGSDRIFRQNEIYKWYGQVQRLHVNEVRSVLMAVPRITSSSGRGILLNRYFLYSESGERRTPALSSRLQRAWFASGLARPQEQQEPTPPEPVPEMKAITDDNDDNCSICFESLSGENEVVMLKCGHYFHKQCILRHQSTSSEYSAARCPNCRGVVTKMYTDGVLRLRF